MNERFAISIFSLILLCGSVLLVHAGASTHLATCDDATLRAAVAQGGEILFDCDGTIVLANTLAIINDVTLDANGRTVTLSGDNAVRLFNVNSNATLTLLGLFLANGRAQAGGGILIEGGRVNLTNCTVSGHTALGASNPGFGGSPGTGGAVLNRLGLLNAESCAFYNNLASGGEGGQGIVAGCGGPGAGGVVANESGEVHLNNCLLIANSAQGGNGANSPFSFGGCGAAASGGVLSSSAGAINVLNSRFEDNRAAGGNAGTGGSGNGGAGGAASGGAITVSNAQLVVANCVFARNETSGGGGARTQPGGIAKGGAIACESGYSSATECSFIENRSVAGYGRQEVGSSASAQGGALFNAGTSTIDRSTLATNSVRGSGASTRPNAGAAGNGEGGGLYNAGSIRISQTTLAGNGATGGSGTIKEGSSFPVAFGTGGNGSGGAIHNGGSLSATNVTMANNRAEAGPGATFPLTGQTGPSGVALGGGIYNSFAAQLADTIIAYSFGLNGSGPISDGGHNISSDSSCNFTAGGSQNNSDPKLGPLANNGGPTLTMALQPGSPAINAGSEVNCAPVDQRGITRPAHGRCDIGAYELVLNDFTLTSITKGAAAVTLQGQGPLGVEFTIQGSSQLEQWDNLANASVQSNGLFNVGIPVDATHQFFRVAQRRLAGAALP